VHRALLLVEPARAKRFAITLGERFHILEQVAHTRMPKAARRSYFRSADLTKHRIHDGAGTDRHPSRIGRVQHTGRRTVGGEIVRIERAPLLAGAIDLIAGDGDGHWRART